MKLRIEAFLSSTGTKVVIALTGLALYAFLFVHLAGNMMFFAGQDKFNAYSHYLISNPLIYPVEIGLALIFILHLVRAVGNFHKNQRARPVPYHVRVPVRHTSRKSVASTTMIYTGVLILVFVGIHLFHFKFGPELHVNDAAGQPTDVKDLHGLMATQFSNPLMVLFYVVSMLVVGTHLWHGSWSALQSLGAGNVASTPRLVSAARIITLVLMAGFVLVPILIFVFYRGAGGTP